MTKEVKDFAVKITVKNNRIIRAMREAGINSIVDLARLSMVPASSIRGVILFKISPIRKKTGEWSDSAWGISSALHKEPEELWPSHIAKLKAKTGFVEYSMDAEEVRQLEAPREFQVDSGRLESLLSKIRPDLRDLVEQKYLEGKTLAEMAEHAGEFGGKVGRERARQKLSQAERQLKHPSRNKHLIDIDDYSIY